MSHFAAFWTAYDILTAMESETMVPDEFDGTEFTDSVTIPVGRCDAVTRTEEGKPAKVKVTRSMRRGKKRAAFAGGLEKPKEKDVVKRHLRNMLQKGAVTRAKVSCIDFKAADGGWMGSRKRDSFSPTESTLQEVLDRDPEFQLIAWDGFSPHALLDSHGNIVAVLAGRANGTFVDVISQATAEFDGLAATLAAQGNSSIGLSKSKQGNRGRFHAVVTGVSYGGGQTKPTQSAIPAVYQHADQKLRASEAMGRLAGFQEQQFRLFFPNIHAYYKEEMAKLWSAFPSLRRPFEKSVMPAAAFNLGPVTVCYPHRDSANLSFGICAITSLGHFSPKTGGHLVLEELKVVVEFPAGSTVLIPSAIMTHSNTTIAKGERRYSFTQYAAGSLFCFIENGMQSERDTVLGLKDGVVEMSEHENARKTRWTQGLERFSHISELMM